ncbi:MAG: hypothetical protein J6Z79_04240 [Clostridia bacterium]|nr:hypothetical protein [Clostridia bacterium]
MIKRYLSLLLAVIMIFSLFLTSCAGNTAEGEEGEEAATKDDDALRKYIAVTVYGITEDSTTEQGLAAVEEKISNYCVARYKTSIDLRLFKESEYKGALNSLYDKFAVQDEENRLAEEAKASSSKAEKELLRKMSKEERQAYAQKQRIADKEAKEAAERAKEEEAKLVEEGKDKSVAADELQLDILFIPTMEEYFNAAKQGLLTDLKPFLDGTNKLITDYVYPSFIGAATMEGAIYGIPTNRGIETKETYFVVNKALAEKYNVDWSAVHSIRDLEGVFQQVKANDPGVTPIYGDFGPEDVTFYAPAGMPAGHFIAVNGSTLLGDPFHVATLDKEDEKDTSQYPFAKSYTSSTRYKDHAFLRFAQWKSEWRQAGYLSDTNQNFFLSVQELSREERQAREDEGYLTVLYKGAPFTSEEALDHGVFAISSRCTQPERAMEILQLLYTDTTLHNLFAFGVEETNYVVKNDGKTVTVIDDSYKMALENTGNTLLGYLPDTMDPDSIENAKSKNINSRLDPFMGFYYDWTDPELDGYMESFAAWESIVGDRFDRLCYGIPNYQEVYNALIEDTKAENLEGTYKSYTNFRDSTTFTGSFRTHVTNLMQLDQTTHFWQQDPQAPDA